MSIAGGSRRIQALAQALRLCHELDAAERNQRLARAALMVAQHVLYRARQRSDPVTRRVR